MRARWAITFLPALGGACSLVTSLDGLSGGTGNGSDAATDGPSAVSDASIEDGGLPTSDGATGYCALFAAQHSFCSDWDQSQAGPTSAWNDAWVLSGEATVTSAPIFTAPGALAAFLPDSGTGAAMSAVAKSFAATSLHCAFDMNVVQTSSGQVGFADFFFGGIGGADLEPAIDGTGMIAAATASVNTPIQMITLGQWHHFDWQITRSGTSASGLLLLDGKQVFFNAQVLQNIPSNATTLGLSLGFSSESTRNWVIAYDDVICDAD